MSNTYLEPDRAYVAKQLDGPVITAFIKAVYNYLHKDIDSHCEYFKHLGIDTADTQHLHFIGKLMGLQLFSLITDAGAGKYITFTDDDYDAEEWGYNNGWSSSYRSYQTGDGVFGTGSEVDYPVQLTDLQYKRILNALSQIDDASASSVMFIDTLVNAFLDSDDYAISYNNGYVDVINVVLGESILQRQTSIVQTMLDKLCHGSTTVLVSHI